ncbi:hypothetical protein B0H11DRAFT_2204553 [Mycena galericulata]|nr:hypothetical protein B0H11DRAFT_2204553 [Mycena galericulata]
MTALCVASSAVACTSSRSAEVAYFRCSPGCGEESYEETHQNVAIRVVGLGLDDFQRALVEIETHQTQDTTREGVRLHAESDRVNLYQAGASKLGAEELRGFWECIGDDIQNLVWFA